MPFIEIIFFIVSGIFNTLPLQNKFIAVAFEIHTLIKRMASNKTNSFRHLASGTPAFSHYL